MIRSAFCLCALALAGCGPAKSLLTDVLYDEVALDDALVRRDLPYLPDGDPKHRLDLFLPLPDSLSQRPWPTVVFVHGGGWNTGDKDLTFGGEDIYGNVGRFLATHGVGAAVVNYRLMPRATWREQVADVAAALAFVQDEVGALGGDADAVALMGHSAGGYLSAFVALDEGVRQRAGAERPCGAVVVSGAALDLVDPATWETGTRFGYYSALFSPSRADVEGPPVEPYAWQVEASPVLTASPGDPPFSIVYGDGEDALFETQAQALARALDAAGVPNRVSSMKVFNHEAGVFTLSRADRAAGAEALRMARECR